MFPERAAFRDRKIAAPLKPVYVNLPDAAAILAFRDRKIAAPLKP